MWILLYKNVLRGIKSIHPFQILQQTHIRNEFSSGAEAACMLTLPGVAGCVIAPRSIKPCFNMNIIIRHSAKVFIFGCFD